MIYPRLPTTTFTRADAVVCFGTALYRQVWEVFWSCSPEGSDHSAHISLSSLGLCTWVNLNSCQSSHNVYAPPEQTASYDEAALWKAKCIHQIKHPARAAHPFSLVPIHVWCAPEFILYVSIVHVRMLCFCRTLDLSCLLSSSLWLQPCFSDPS